MMDRWSHPGWKNVALVHSYHEGKSCSKFGFPPSGLGDSAMDRQRC